MNAAHLCATTGFAPIPAPATAPGHVSVRYQARVGNQSSLDVTVPDMPRDVHLMLAWLTTHPDLATSLLPAYQRVRTQWERHLQEQAPSPSDHTDLGRAVRNMLALTKAEFNNLDAMAAASC